MYELYPYIGRSSHSSERVHKPRRYLLISLAVLGPPVALHDFELNTNGALRRSDSRLPRPDGSRRRRRMRCSMQAARRGGHARSVDR